MIFGEIGQFLFVDDLLVSLLMEFQALLDECVKLMLLFLSILQDDSHSGDQTELLQLSVQSLVSSFLMFIQETYTLIIPSRDI